MRLPGTIARSLFAALVTFATADAQGINPSASGTIGPGHTMSGSHGPSTRPTTTAPGLADKQQCETFLTQWDSLSGALKSSQALIDRRNACSAIVNRQ